MKLFSLIFFILSFISCKNELIKNEPSLCQIKSDFWEIASNEQAEFMLDLKLFGIEQNVNAPYFFVSFSSMAGVRLAYFTVCNGLVLKQVVLVPNRIKSPFHIVLQGEFEVRYFTSKEIVEDKSWKKLENDLFEAINVAPDSVIDMENRYACKIQFNDSNNRLTLTLADSISSNLLEYINEIFGIETIWTNCETVCEMFF